MQYDFNLLAGQSQNIDVKGRFFKYKSGTGMIRVRTSLGGAVDLLPGQGVENVAFTGLTVSDRSGAGNVGSILAGDFDFRDDRITGTVEVVDGGKTRTLAGQAFLGGTAAIGTGTQYAHLQLASVNVNKRVVVKTIMIFTNVTQQVNLTTNPGLLATLEGYAQSKAVGGAQSTAQMRSALTTALTGSAPFFTFPTVTAGVPFLLTLQEPIVLLGGQNLLVEAASVGTYLGATFEFIEEVL